MQRIKNQIKTLLEKKERVIISIEGGAASGKTTLSAHLAEVFAANLYHMDDFFLPPFLRTPDRLSQAGGNVHYERFYEEVVRPLLSGKAFSYGVFNCHAGKITSTKEAPQNRVHIIEGVYSAHPYFGDIYDLRVFLDVDAIVQRERIKARNPASIDAFFTRWIPMENQYFSAFSVREQSDIILKSTDC